MAAAWGVSARGGDVESRAKHDPPKWEYKVVTFSFDDLKELNKAAPSAPKPKDAGDAMVDGLMQLADAMGQAVAQKLNRLGADGWELAAVTCNDGRVYLKRPIR